MTDDGRSPGEAALAAHEAFEAAGETFRLATTVFEASVSVDGERYTVEVTVPTLDSAAVEEVGPTVSTDWLETFERRVQDAPAATRHPVDLDDLGVTEDGDEVLVHLAYARDDPEAAVDVAKTFAEYVEGTYAQGLVPGYEYTGPAARLLSAASQGEGTGTPL